MNETSGRVKIGAVDDSEYVRNIFRAIEHLPLDWAWAWPRLRWVRLRVTHRWRGKKFNVRPSHD